MHEHESNSVGTLYVVAAASGTGKTSLVNALIEELPGVVLSISHTTRPKREAETAGEHYHFVDQALFLQMIEQDAFFEHAEVFGNYYGTSRAWIDARLTAGDDVVLEIDWQGAEQVKRQRPEAVGIFILPPSLETLRERLQRRQQDTLDVINRRFSIAQEEIQHYASFEYLVINDHFDQALHELKTIVLAERLHTVRQAVVRRALLAALLKKR